MTLSNLAKRIFSGVTPLAKGNAYVEPPMGVRFLRSGEITREGSVTDVSEVHISETVHNGMMKHSQLHQGDLLIAIVGATIGSVGIYDRCEPANINQAIAAVRLSDPRLSREFAYWYLQSSLGQKLLDFFKRPVARANINLEEVGEIPFLIPEPSVQRELVAAMDRARSVRQIKLSEAHTLLSGLDSFLINELGLTRPLSDDRKTFAIYQSDALKQGRINSDYYHPERILALRAMAVAAGHLNCSRLDEVVDFIRDQIKTPGPNYLSLANVQSHTGELIEADEESAGACSVFKHGDVLFARLRPYLNKVYSAELNGCCSPEFYVLRVRDTKVIHADYLAAILRSSLILAQTRHMMTGNTHPRLTSDDVVNLIIPIPKSEVQDNIVSEIRRRREEARRLRVVAESAWQEAKHWFEEQLLGGDHL